MLRLWILLALIDLLLTLWALIVCATTEDEDFEVFPKPIWMIVIIFLPLAGPILWFVYGRRPRQRRPSPGRPAPARPLAPDDDPEFLRGLAAGQRDSTTTDLELMRKWEEDLRRREEQLRRKSEPDEPTG